MSKEKHQRHNPSCSGKGAMPEPVAEPLIENPSSQKEGHDDKESVSGSAANEKKPSERIVDRLDLQLLVAIIVFFVSGWAYLNNRICNFTASEPNAVQMSYIFVHYTLTLFLVLCVYITFIKGNYVLKRVGDVSPDNITCIRLFIESWFPTFIICIAVLATASFIPWYYWAAATVVLLYLKTWHLGIHLPNRFTLLLIVILGFPLFISTMTIVVKDIDVLVDKEYYSISDDIIVSVDTKGYACDHTLVCLDTNNLYPDTDYTLEKNKIILPASCVKNNVISVGTVSPAHNRFFRYPFYKMMGIDPPSARAFSLREPGEKKSEGVYFTSRNLSIR